MSPAPRRPAYDGPAILSHGFRPFFLAGSVWAVIAVLVWMPQYFGKISLTTAFTPLDWHIHEALFGYVAAVAAGFLLTAIPNWTGRLPLQGVPLLVLLLVWLAGRFAIAASAWLGWAAAALIDCAFLTFLCLAIARELIAGKNWKNLKVLAVLVLLLAANAAFHIEAHVNGSAFYGKRLGVAMAVALVILIGGRVIPSFTRNFLARRAPGRLPANFGAFDKLSVAAAVLALLAWTFAPGVAVTGGLLIVAGLLHFARLARWAGDRAFADALVLVLHLGYAFAPLGFLLVGLSAFTLRIPESAGVHAWTAGAIGVMTLAIMTRASLGHTGQSLHAGPATLAIYGASLLAVLARIGAALLPEWSFILLHIAAFAWAGAFLGFALAYGKALLSPRGSS
ncbi:NnrS family protein [Methylocella silvestris BL2]|uniref:NnrS family protein n=1 Tax=Methylocella silvestris (strain DSM 15510 / CIP 108128 / LMG 27833 / NCIMB 13906 / BL2) TaxID=395965 RepID=B8EHZ2_METSB|nr:NnrS family protein [Methylocella silvestris]ACK50474.1 NnrS family protein [Methylocella silvestris BL2]